MAGAEETNREVARRAAARVVDRTARVVAREQALDEREREFTKRAEAFRERQQTLRDREAKLEGRERSLANRERELTERIAAFDASKAEAERVAGQLRAQERALAERQTALAASDPPPERVVEAAAPPSEPDAAGADVGLWNIDELARWAEEHAGEFPDQIEEWRAYVLSLRVYAQPDGTLPKRFDALVADAFAPLLELEGVRV